VKQKKLSEPAPSAVAEPEVDLTGACFSINLILPGNPGSRFWPRCTPLPPETRVSAKFAREIEEFRIDPRREDEPLEPTLVFQTGVSYSVDAQGRRRGRRVEREAVELMRARQADELLHEQLMEEKRAIEESEWFQARQVREIELANMENRSAFAKGTPWLALALCIRDGLLWRGVIPRG
jgi:hypothetical protein